MRDTSDETHEIEKVLALFLLMASLLPEAVGGEVTSFYNNCLADYMAKWKMPHTA